jgi:hypothetical protein
MFKGGLACVLPEATAAVVAIRTFLSFSLEVELEGVWPWARKRAASTSQDG